MGGLWVGGCCLSGCIWGHAIQRCSTHAVHLAAALTVEARVRMSADTVLFGAATRRGIHVANPLDR